MKDYEQLVMLDVYNIISTKGFVEDDTFTKPERGDYLKLLLEYFEDVEHYDKCTKLRNMIKKMETTDENSSKGNPSRS